MKEKATERTTVDADLYLAEVGRAAEAEKVSELEAKLKASEEANAKLKEEIAQSKADYLDQNNFFNSMFEPFINFKDKLVSE